jgi:hypothetical protein
MSLPSAASLRRGLSPFSLSQLISSVLLLENFCVIFGLKLTWPSFIGGRKSGSFCTDRTEDMLLGEMSNCDRLKTCLDHMFMQKKPFFFFFEKAEKAFLSGYEAFLLIRSLLCLFKCRYWMQSNLL